MKFDFTTIMDRSGRDAVAVDAPPNGVSNGFFPVTAIQEGFSVIPMWVADMNFPTVPSITDAIAKRASHPAFGYFLPTAAYYDAIIQWHASRHGVVGLTPEHIGYENGVLGGAISALRVLCSNGDPILIHSPTYVGFTHCIEDNGWDIVLSPLVKDREGIWRMDYDDMERKIVSRHIHAAVLCSPHNPSGRVWERWELERAMAIFRRHDVYVVSDEIWSDLTLPGYTHIPTQSISEDAKGRTIALYAPSKTFNLAGLVGSYHIIYDRYLRERITREGALTHYNNMNVLSMHALIGAYTDTGAQWIDQLRQVIDENLHYAVSFIHKNFPGVEAQMPQGTYMLFLDCTEWCSVHHVDIEALQKRGISVGVIWQDGRPFHGPCHIRLNLALPKSKVIEAFDRMERYVFIDKNQPSTTEPIGHRSKEDTWERSSILSL